MIYSIYKYSLFVYSVYQLINEQNESKIEKLAENVKNNAVLLTAGVFADPSRSIFSIFK